MVHIKIQYNLELTGGNKFDNVFLGPTCVVFID